MQARINSKLIIVGSGGILKGGFNKEKIFASATPTSGHVVVPCTSCALKNCNVL